MVPISIWELPELLFKTLAFVITVDLLSIAIAPPSTKFTEVLSLKVQVWNIGLEASLYMLAPPPRYSRELESKVTFKNKGSVPSSCAALSSIYTPPPFPSKQVLFEIVQLSKTGSAP